MTHLSEHTIHRLAEMWATGELDADTYFEEVDRRAKEAVEREVKAERWRRGKP